MKKYGIIILILIILGVPAYFIADFFQYIRSPAGNIPIKALIRIPAGQNFRTTVESLHHTGIIEDKFRFRILANIKGYERKIKAGEYLLLSSMTPLDILDNLAEGRIFFHKILIAEGFNIYQIADVIDYSGLITKKAFLDTATDRSFVRRKGINADTFEGYLFPDTYYFPINVSAEGIICNMLKRFQEIFTPALQERTKQLNLSVHQIITIASIIEKETSAEFERPLISAVFHNRLKRKMRLESDPTVIYGIKNFDGNLTRSHLNKPTPYNTYIINGLPPGPIANPGAASIKAALYPANSDSLFFVSKNDGTHIFSSNLSDHNRAVRKYQSR